jgi:hypothetical protein
MPDTLIQHEMPFADYCEMPGLSYSGLKDLAVSPLRYWHLNVNPNRPPKEDTAFTRFGSALHCAVLEPSCFESRYCPEINESDFPEGCLVTMDDLRTWLKDNGYKPNGKLKADLVSQVSAIAPEVPILDVVRERDELENADKIRLSKEDWARVRSAADSLRSEPSLIPILSDPEGRSEVSLSAVDPNTKVVLKGRLDWWTPSLTLDLKSFSQQRGKSIDRTVHDAIFYEHYNWQAVHYTTIRTILGDRKPRYIMAFVESDPPHEVRLKELRPMTRQINMYWETARAEVRTLIYTYADCLKKYGDRPWRDERGIELLDDVDIPQLAFAR